MRSFPKDWHWTEFVQQDDDFWNDIRSSLVSFVAIGPRYTPRHVGTGFVIASSADGLVLCLTAKHVVEEAVIQTQCPEHHIPNVPRLLLPPRRPKIGAKEMRAIWMGRGTGDMLHVRHIHYADVVDVAVCLLEFQDHFKEEHPNVRPSAISLDTRLPDLGSEIRIVALTDFAFEGSSPLGDGAGEWSVSTRAAVRGGTVLSHEDQVMGHQGPAFTTSIPVPPGMSGGFAYNPEVPVVSACGIISSSREDDTPVRRFTDSGHSTVVGILGCLGLNVPKMINGNDIHYNRLIDLILAGDITEQSCGGRDIILREYTDGSYEITKKSIG